MKTYGGKRASINYLIGSLPGREQLKEVENLFQHLLSNCIYNALIQSQFDYCNIIWGNCGKTLIDRRKKFQNRATHVVLTFSWYNADPTAYLGRQLNWKDLSPQFQIQKALMAYKSLNDLVPSLRASSPTFQDIYPPRPCLHGVGDPGLVG